MLNKYFLYIRAKQSTIQVQGLFGKKNAGNRSFLDFTHAIYKLLKPKNHQLAMCDKIMAFMTDFD